MAKKSKLEKKILDAINSLEKKDIIAFFRDGSIYAINSDGSDERVLIDKSKVFERLPSYLILNQNERLPFRWSNNGKYIAFQSTLNTGKEEISTCLGVYDFETDSIRKFPKSQGFYPNWSNDDTEISYLDQVWRYSIVHLLNLESEKITRQLYGDSYIWSKTGKIAYIQNYSGNLGGAVLLNLLNLGSEVYIKEKNNAAKRIYKGAHLEHLQWSPSSRYLSFMAIEKQANYIVYDAAEDKVALKKKIMEGNYQISYDWSPDSASVAYSYRNALRVMEVPSGEMRNLADGSNPSWSPDGKEIAYEWNSKLHLISVDGTGKRAVTQGSLPAWRPR